MLQYDISLPATFPFLAPKKEVCYIFVGKTESFTHRNVTNRLEKEKKKGISRFSSLNVV